MQPVAERARDRDLRSPSDLESKGAAETFRPDPRRSVFIGGLDPAVISPASAFIPRPRAPDARPGKPARAMARAKSHGRQGLSRDSDRRRGDFNRFRAERVLLPWT